MCLMWQPALTDAGEELRDDTDEVAQAQPVVRHNAFHLVELSQVRRV